MAGLVFALTSEEDYSHSWSLASYPHLGRLLFADGAQLCRGGCWCHGLFPCALGGWEVSCKADGKLWPVGCGLDVVQTTCLSMLCTSASCRDAVVAAVAPSA